MNYTARDLALLAVLDTVSVVAMILFAFVLRVPTLHLTILGYSIAVLVLLAHLLVLKPEWLGMEGTWA